MVPPKPGNYPSRNLCWCPARGQPHPYVRPPLRCNGWCQPCPVDRVLDAGCGQTIFAIDIYREDGHFEIFWPPTKGFYGVFNVFLHFFRILSTPFASARLHTQPALSVATPSAPRSPLGLKPQNFRYKNHQKPHGDRDFSLFPKMTRCSWGLGIEARRLRTGAKRWEGFFVVSFFFCGGNSRNQYRSCRFLSLNRL